MWPVASTALDMLRDPPSGHSGIPFSRHSRYVGEAGLLKVALLHLVAVYGRDLGVKICDFIPPHFWMGWDLEDGNGATPRR